MRFKNFLLIVQSKINSIRQIEGLMELLDREFKDIEKNISEDHQEESKTIIKERYARKANRIIRDLYFDADDFTPDIEDD